MNQETLHAPTVYLGLLGLLVLPFALSQCIDGFAFWSAGDSARQSFVEVTDEAKLSAFRHETGAFGEKRMPETLGGGVTFFDYESDGDQDLLLVGGDTWPSVSDTTVLGLRLYRNIGDGQFEEYTQDAGLDSVEAYGFKATTADYDNDGDQDIYLTTLNRNRLFRNDDGAFTEVGRQAGVAGPPEWSTTSVFFDADRDGHLDLYVGNYVEWSASMEIYCTRRDRETRTYCTPDHYKGIAGRFYHNNGDGTFTEWTKRAGIRPSPGKALGATVLDVNHDGWLDLVVANDRKRTLLFINQGDGTFNEDGTSRGFTNRRAGMGIDIAHVDSTNHPLIVIGNFTGQKMGVYQATDIGVFKNRWRQTGLDGLSPLMWGLFFFDVELDRDLDLFVANGPLDHQIQEDSTAVLKNYAVHAQDAQLFLNKGNGSFREVNTPPDGLLSTPMDARGAAYADVDGDGDLDVAVTEADGPIHLWENRTHHGNYLRVHLRGTQSNRDGIGARVVAKVGDQRLRRMVRPGTSYLSQPEKTVTFGLQDQDHVDTLRVYWPSGTVTERIEVEANQTLKVKEPVRISSLPRK
ncbi:MAG: CRTAC1 family protein [Salinibacter sp.]